MHKKYTEGSICMELGLIKGNNRPDIDYLRFSLDIPEHYEALKAKGYDVREKNLKRTIPFSAAYYIISTVFKHNPTGSDSFQ